MPRRNETASCVFNHFLGSFGTHGVARFLHATPQGNIGFDCQRTLGCNWRPGETSATYPVLPWRRDRSLAGEAYRYLAVGVILLTRSVTQDKFLATIQRVRRQQEADPKDGVAVAGEVLGEVVDRRVDG